MNVSRAFADLEAIAAGLRTPAKRLALSIGNYRGTNDFAGKRSVLVNAFVLDELRQDLISMVVLRAWALVAPRKSPSDITMMGAAELLGNQDVKTEIIERARSWRLLTDDIAQARAHNITEQLDEFLNILAALDIDALRRFRNWVLAHITSNPTPHLQLGTTLMIGEQVLTAFDKLDLIVRGEYEDVLGLSQARREQTLDFWEGFESNSLSQGQSLTDINDTGSPLA